jgi:hypothetical protein
MSEQLRISGKHLGELALPDACPKCLWLKLKLHHRLPFQIFPGIFSSIDAYTKRVVHGWFDQHGETPPWLSELGELCGYQEPPHWSVLKWVDPRTNILLTGTPDGVLKRPNGSVVIVDYKTAKYSGTQDALFPMYDAQLNSYALVGEATKVLSPVSGLALIYMEPVTDDAAAEHETNRREDGFAMGFKAYVHPVPLRPESIPPLLERARALFDMKESPEGLAGCKCCELLSTLAEIS